MNVAANIAAELRDRIGLLAVERVGAEPTLRTRQTWRFHPRGGLAIEVGGQRHGLWCDHAAGVGGDGLDLVQHLRGGSVTDALAWSRSWLGHTPGQPRPAAPAPVPGLSEADNGQDRRRKQESAQQVRQHAVDAAGTDVERYLASRGLSLPAGHHDVLRYHQHCLQGESSWSTMVGLMRDAETSEPCTGAICLFPAPARQAASLGRRSSATMAACGEEADQHRRRVLRAQAAALQDWHMVSKSDQVTGSDGFNVLPVPACANATYEQPFTARHFACLDGAVARVPLRSSKPSLGSITHHWHCVVSHRHRAALVVHQLEQNRCSGAQLVLGPFGRNGGQNAWGDGRDRMHGTARVVRAGMVHR